MSKAVAVQRCPFCGSQVRVKIGLNRLHFFYCKNEEECGAIVSFQGGPNRREAEDPEDNWNRRVFLLNESLR